MDKVRTTARLLLLDEQGRVLLFRHADGHGRALWAAPGGGVEPGETPEEAAHREAAEELGATEVELVPLWTGHSDYIFANHPVSQTEEFFLVVQHAGILGPVVEETHRRERITAVRWWTLDEIEATTEPLFPTDLADRVRNHLATRQ